MASISTMYKMISGINTSQTGLKVTGHNIANVNTTGYSRQQALQNDSKYVKSGTAGSLGLGVSITEIRQIRDNFADVRFRQENSILSYYNVQKGATDEIETILDEPNGECMSSLMDSFWRDINRMSNNPAGLEERLSFIQSSSTMIKKANQIMESLVDYQNNLNNQVIEAVDSINTLIDSVNSINESIAKSELNGDNANDLRDQRNNLLDSLSQYINIDCSEDKYGRVSIKIEGRDVIDSGITTKLSVSQTTPGSPYVKPIWGDTGHDLFKLTTQVNLSFDNARGSLKSMLVARGEEPANYLTSWDNIALNKNISVSEEGNSYTIPKLQKELSTFINEMTEVVNSSLDGYGTGNSSSLVGSPLFVPTKSIDGSTLPTYPMRDDFTSDADYNTAMVTYKKDIEKHLVPGNIEVNQELIRDDGYTKLGTIVESGDYSDNSKINNLLSNWSTLRNWNVGVDSKTAPYEKNSSFTDFYTDLVSDIGVDGYEAAGKVSEHSTVVKNIDNKRLSMSGVSQDEELANMMMYQYAYNASARMITILDSMIESVINII